MKTSTKKKTNSVLRMLLIAVVVMAMSFVLISCDNKLQKPSDDKLVLPGGDETESTGTETSEKDPNQTNSPGSTPPNEGPKKLRAGLYAADTDTLLQSWNFLIESGTVVVKENTITSSGDIMGDLRIPDNITQIGKKAFANKAGLTGVYLGANVVSIGDGAFSGCTGLTHLAFEKSATTIGNSAFYGCTGLESLVVGDGVTNIGSKAFYGCADLQYLVVSDNVSTLGANAFAGCTGLKAVYVGRSVTNISDNAFNGCTALTSIYLPRSVSNIGAKAFFNCGAFVVSYEGHSAGYKKIAIGKSNETLEAAITTYNVSAATEKANVLSLIDELNDPEEPIIDLEETSETETQADPQ